MSMNCGGCKHSHLMVCEKEGKNCGKKTLLIQDDIDDCFEERELKRAEKNRYWNDCYGNERMETREYYDMTGEGDLVYRIGYVEKEKNSWL